MGEKSGRTWAQDLNMRGMNGFDRKQPQLKNERPGSAQAPDWHPETQENLQEPGVTCKASKRSCMFTGGRGAGSVSPEHASRSAACCSASSGCRWAAEFWPTQGAGRAAGLKTEDVRHTQQLQGETQRRARDGCRRAPHEKAPAGKGEPAVF